MSQENVKSFFVELEKNPELNDADLMNAADGGVSRAGLIIVSLVTFGIACATSLIAGNSKSTGVCCRLTN